MHFYTTWGCSKDKIGRSGTQFYDRKPMRSITLQKNFQEVQ